MHSFAELISTASDGALAGIFQDHTLIQQGLVEPAYADSIVENVAESERRAKGKVVITI